MATVLYGRDVTASKLLLLDEIRALRQRVAELQAALDAARDKTPPDLHLVRDDEPAAAGV